ncbi:MAG: protein-disulfide reductase DsbD, partial [Gammaproteobacteria bacterium]|nr:protein-disulfide reductase DsbD [Gammaproteobacteria bacterium]
ADVRFPQSQLKQNPNHIGEEVYSGQVTIPVALQTMNQQIQLSVDYQGCSERGFCYPPMSKTYQLDLTNHAALPAQGDHHLSAFYSSFRALLTDQNDVHHLFSSQSLGVMLLIFAGLGLLLAFTPCVLPMIPILTSIIVGHKQPVSTKKAFLLSSTYVLGASITYAMVGIVAALMGNSLQAWLQQPWIIAMVSILFVILSLSLFGLYDLRLPRYWQNHITAISRKQEGGTYIGVFIMGIVSTLIVSPCVTAPLVGVLMYIAQSGNVVLGAGALFVMSVGMGMPLIAIGVSTGKWMPRRGPWMNAVQKTFGVLMLCMAAWLFSRVVSFPESTAASSFVVVHNEKDLHQQLINAQALRKPVLLDFYADWCESCVSMDKKVFNEPSVRHVLNQFVLLRADLSANNADDAALLKTYNVIAPPTVLFFNHQGQEVNSHRIVGELSAQEFMTRINTFITASCDKKVTC